MNQFEKHRYLYAGGKIKKGHDESGYRSKIAHKLAEHGIFVLDPLRGKYNTDDWKNINPVEIVTRDLQDIKRSHVMLAVMMDCKDTSFGTPCEVMYAWLQHIPVILITDDEYLAGHPWVKAMCSRVFLQTNDDYFNDTLDKAVDHIVKWYSQHTEDEVYTDPELYDNNSCDKKATGHVVPISAKEQDRIDFNKNDEGHN